MTDYTSGAMTHGDWLYTLMVSCLMWLTALLVPQDVTVYTSGTTRCNCLYYGAMGCNCLYYGATGCNCLYHGTTGCNCLYYGATGCNCLY